MVIGAEYALKLSNNKHNVEISLFIDDLPANPSQMNGHEINKFLHNRLVVFAEKQDKVTDYTAKKQNHTGVDPHCSPTECALRKQGGLF